MFSIQGFIKKFDYIYNNILTNKQSHKCLVWMPAMQVIQATMT